jgi:glucans biosynthesis protein C
MSHSVSKPDRLFYLDAVRAFAMFFGIFVHGSTIANPIIEQMPPLFFIQFWSDLFRVAIFFLVSVFFTAMVFTKQSVWDYAQSRFRVIVVPLLASLICIAPFTNWMIHTWHNGSMTFGEYLTGGWRNATIGNDTWALHLWFLFSLLIYAVLAPLFMWLIQSSWFGRAVNRYLDHTSGFTIWTNVLLFVVAILVGRAAYDQGFRYFVDETRWAWITRATIFYMPMVFLGMVTFSYPRFRETISVFSPSGLLLFVGLYTATHVWGAELPRGIERIIYWTARGGLSFFVISAVLWLSEKYFNKPSAILTYAINSAYSFYLFHLTFIYIVAWALRAFTGNLYLIYVGIVVIATPLTLLWHTYVIDRWPVLRFLFTGKRMGKSRL